MCGLVCPSRTTERGGEGDGVKEGEEEEGEREREPRRCTGAAAQCVRLEQIKRTGVHSETVCLGICMGESCGFR